jgi:hypothetical protein
MMRRLQRCRPLAFAEAGAAVRLPATFRIERTRVDHAGAHRSTILQPHLLLFPLPEPFRHTRTESQKIFKPYSCTVRLSST